MEQSARKRSFLDFARRNLRLDPKAAEVLARPQMVFPLSRYQRAIGKQIILRGAVQTLKNMSVSAALYAKCFLDPGRVGYYTPTDALLDGFLGGKFDATWKDNPLLQWMCDSENKKLHRIDQRRLRNGSLMFLSGGAIGNRQSHSFDWIIIDEAWLLEQKTPGAMKEIEDRGENYQEERNIIYLTNGYDSDKGLADMAKRAMRYRWVVPCDSCARPMHYKFFQPKPIAYEQRQNSAGHKLTIEGAEMWQPYGGMYWSEGEDVRRADGELNHDLVGKTVYYECEHCGHRHADDLRARELRNERSKRGEFAKGSTDHVKDGYLHLNPEDGESKIEHIESNSLSFRAWAPLVSKYISARNKAAQGMISDLENIYRKELAIPWNPAGVIQSSRQLERGRGSYRMAIDGEGYGEILSHWGAEWSGAWVFLTVDVQKDHYWFAVRAWKHGVGSRLVLCGKCFDDGEIAALAERFKIRCSPGDHAIYLNDSTGKYELDAGCLPGVALDGNYEPGRVQRLCAANGWICFRGTDTGGFKDANNIEQPISQMQPIDTLNGLQFARQGEIKANRQYCPEHKIANTLARNRFQELRTAAADGGDTFWTYAENAGPDYEKHMRSWYRQRKVRAKDGADEYVWRKVSESARDDLYWCEKAQFALAMLHGFWG